MQYVRVNYGEKPYWKCKGCEHPFPSGKITIKQRWSNKRGGIFVDQPHFEFSNDGNPCMNGECLDLDKKCPFCVNTIVNKILT
ncbi:MAG: hypothetical protein CMG17_01030 [Candidatus Marinimicrobia bacterium]|jgi:hypothetical protein|nr:hypothetical protein [Candidatus Neomarinimicrobiota bacterium]